MPDYFYPDQQWGRPGYTRGTVPPGPLYHPFSHYSAPIQHQHLQVLF